MTAKLKSGKSRPLRRKTSHSVIERRRRVKINEGLIHLQSTVPACRQELRELLECKTHASKKNAKRGAEDLQREVDRLLKEKIGSQMVLEKLCIISHTVDYVEELQAKVEAYRKLYRSSPPITLRDSSGSHKQAHLDGQAEDSLQDGNGDSASLSISEESEVAKCDDCAIESMGKRHWGSNKPLRLNRRKSEGGGKEGNVTDRIHSTSSKRKESPESNVDTLGYSTEGEEESESDHSSDLELEASYKKEHHHWSSHLYTNCCDNNHSNLVPHRKRRFTHDSTLAPTAYLSHNQDCDETRLGLLAQVSAETRKEEAIRESGMLEPSNDEKQNDIV